MDNIAQRPRKVSNPFHPVDPEKEKWASEKKQFFVHMKMMKDQLDSEKTARIESQVGVRSDGCHSDGLVAVVMALTMTSFFNLLGSCGTLADAEQRTPLPPPETDVPTFPDPDLTTIYGGQCCPAHNFHPHNFTGSASDHTHI